jgi:hypothetical protein
VTTGAAWLNLTYIRASGRTKRNFNNNFDFDGGIQGGHAYFPPHHKGNFTFELYLRTHRKVRCQRLLPSAWSAWMQHSVKSDVFGEFAGTLGSPSDEHVLGYRWTADFHADLTADTVMFLVDPCKNSTKEPIFNVAGSSMSYNVSAEALGGTRQISSGIDLKKFWEQDEQEVEKAWASVDPLKSLIKWSMFLNFVRPVIGYPVLLGALAYFAYCLFARAARLASDTDVVSDLRCVELAGKSMTSTCATMPSTFASTPSTFASTPSTFRPAPSSASSTFWPSSCSSSSLRAPTSPRRGSLVREYSHAKCEALLPHDLWSAPSTVTSSSRQQPLPMWSRQSTDDVTQSALSAWSVDVESALDSRPVTPFSRQTSPETPYEVYESHDETGVPPSAA